MYVCIYVYIYIYTYTHILYKYIYKIRDLYKQLRDKKRSKCKSILFFMHT